MLSSSALFATACSRAMVPHALLMVCFMKYTSRSAASCFGPRSACDMREAMTLKRAALKMTSVSRRSACKKVVLKRA